MALAVEDVVGELSLGGSTATRRFLFLLHYTFGSVVLVSVSHFRHCIISWEEHGWEMGWEAFCLFLLDAC